MHGTLMAFEIGLQVEATRAYIARITTDVLAMDVRAVHRLVSYLFTK